jgi:PAS domain S-box-containing protein
MNTKTRSTAPIPLHGSAQVQRFSALTPGVLAGFLAIVTVLAGARYVGLANLRTVDASRDAVAHTYAAKAALEQLLATLIDAETGERGFLVTGDRSYLEPYDGARRAIAAHFDTVRSLTADNREQQTDLDQVVVLADRKLEELAEAIRQRQNSGFEAAQRVVRTNVGKHTMDEARGIVARMEARDDALLAQRTAQAARSYRTAVATGWTSTGIALLVVGMLFFAVRRLGTERVQAAEAAERLRVTLGSIGDAVIATDDQGQVISMNGVAETLTGWRAAGAFGRRLEEIFVIINEESRRPVENPIGRVLRERVIVGLANHTVLISKDGREIPVDDSAAPITTADGRFAGAIMVFRDVSERRRVERERTATIEAERRARTEAQDAEKRLRIALQAGRMGTWEYSVRSGEVKWSPGLEAIHGLAPGTFPGTFDAFQREIHPADRDRVLNAITDAVDGGRDHEIEYRIVRADGSVRWVEGRGQLFVRDDGEPERMVGVCTDITERKHAEERFQLIVEASPTAMIAVDARGTIVFVNALTERLLGYDRQELVGQSIERLVPTRFRDSHPEHRDAFFAELQRRPMGAGRELFAVRKDGSEVPVEIGLSPFHTADGTFVLAAVADITERKRAEDERTQLLEREQAAHAEAEAANRAKDEFLAMISHELRTPLNAVLGWADMLRGGMLQASRRERAAEAIYASARRQEQLIGELLDVSRIISGKLRLERDAIDLSEVVRAAVDVVQSAAHAKQIHIAVDLEPSLGPFYADGARLQQVLWNLLSNAIKFTPEGGAIHLRGRRIGPDVELTVTDTGQGIPAAFLSSVFEPFQQADRRATTRRHGGLGLGLAIVKHLVEAHGGAVTAASAGEGQGATFVVRLPIVPVYTDQADARSTTVDQPPVALSPTSLNGLSVLVVDDDDMSCDVVAVTLETYGAHVVAVETASEALHVTMTQHVDVLLSDVGMPNDDGYTLIRAIRGRELQSERPLPAAALTSFARDEDRQRALDAGFQLHLAKPIDSRALVEAVANLANRMPMS